LLFCRILIRHHQVPNKEINVKKVLATVAAFAFLTGVSGCGSKGESLVKEQISLMNQMADEIEGSASKEKLEEIGKKMKETGKQLEDLKLSADEKKKLEDKYKPEMEKALKRMMDAAMKKSKGGFKMPDIGGLKP
jgi:hypothetical protein